jgi:DNA-binding MarR family transcriptional regulator
MSTKERRRLAHEVREAMRALSIQLMALNQRVGHRLDLRTGDLECLDLISRHGPVSPTALARLARVHPATLTGVLDRLESGGWITRERDPNDRRAVLVDGRKERGAQVYALYAGMNTALDAICAGYSQQELTVIGDFLRRAAAAGNAATDALG